MDLDMRNCATCGFRYQPTGRNQKNCGACRGRAKEASRLRRTAPRDCTECDTRFTPHLPGRPRLCCSTACLIKRTSRLRQARIRDDQVYRKKLRATNVVASRKYRKRLKKSKQ